MHFTVRYGGNVTFVCLPGSIIDDRSMRLPSVKLARTPFSDCFAVWCGSTAWE
jgi:hypothetical protein